MNEIFLIIAIFIIAIFMAIMNLIELNELQLRRIKKMIKNYFITQLEDEIANNYSIKYVEDTKKQALYFNKFEDDKIIKKENEEYILRLVSNYKS